MEFMRLLAESSESSILASEALLVAGVGMLASPVAALITWMLNKKKRTAAHESTTVQSMDLLIRNLQAELARCRDNMPPRD